MLLLVLLPILGKAQSKPNRSLISSLEMSLATYNTKVFEAAVLFGLKDNSEHSTLEIGYVFKRIVNKGVGHSPIYHGVTSHKGCSNRNSYL